MIGLRFSVLSTAACLACGQAAAFTFETEDGLRGSFDSTVSVGTGIRVKDPTPGLIASGNTGSPAGGLSAVSGLGDQGDLNYKKGQPFTTYLKGSHELVLKPSEDLTFMGRITWLKDVSATNTSGYRSANAPADLPSDNLSYEARKALRVQTRVLDLWVSKSFDLGEQRARLRVGNQVISWGESLFIPGGINATNALDINRLSQPGTQLKEAVLPAPMVSLATGIGPELNFEGYVQAAWNPNFMPPTGGYWSTADGLGAGHQAYGLSTVTAKNGGQWGLSLRYQPTNTRLNLGLYALNYHDKAPQFSSNINGSGLVGWTYAQNRRLYGVSANFPLGDWAIGTELSYRPRDAVALNSSVDGCAGNGGNCWVDEKRYQWHLTGIYSQTQSNSKPILDFLGADTGTFMGELVLIRYPGLKSSYNGELVSAGGYNWGQQYSASAAQIAAGTRNSSGISLDYSWVYDGKLIKGWQVVPEVAYFRALSGRTPNTAATFMQGASSINLIVSFIQNPATWQFGVNYAAFWGGKTVYDQPLRDRNFVGVYASRNF